MLKCGHALFDLLLFPLYIALVFAVYQIVVALLVGVEGRVWGPEPYRRLLGWWIWSKSRRWFVKWLVDLLISSLRKDLIAHLRRHVVRAVRLQVLGGSRWHRGHQILIDLRLRSRIIRNTQFKSTLCLSHQFHSLKFYRAHRSTRLNHGLSGIAKRWIIRHRYRPFNY